MAQLLVRDVSPDLVDALKRRAAEHGRSAEAEHRAILEQVLQGERDAFRESARALRRETGGHANSDSADLIRQARDSR